MSGSPSGPRRRSADLGYAIGVLHLPLVIGLSVTFGCVILAALGVQIARRGPSVAAIGMGLSRQAGARGRTTRHIHAREKKADYHHGDLKRALIETAVKAIARHGVDAVSLRELAARAGVTPGAPYHHFASRDELLASIAEEGFRATPRLG